MPGRWKPSLWASWKPFGLGEQRPNNYLEIGRALWENRGRLGYAWRILDHGVCDGCALGTSGMRDWTIEGTHLCNIRLRLLRLNTMRAFDSGLLANVPSLKEKTSAELRELGRLPEPMIRRRGEPGFTALGWDEALALIAARLASVRPERLGFYLTSRGVANETYYAAQKAVRALGTNSIDNAARVCHSPSTFGLKSSLGVAASTCSYRDWMQSDLVLFIGSNVANNQPVAMKYLYYAKKAGVKVAVINTYREPGMERYWIPSDVESAVFGTRITDRFFLVDTGGDIPFLNGVAKSMIELGLVDRAFITEHTSGFAELEGALARQSWEELERGSGSTRADMESLARMLGEARKAVFVWSMGITQHQFGEDNVRAIVNLALTKGFVGREGSGLMPIRGHSGVQGGAEMGAYATALPGGLPINPANAARCSELWGFPVPTARGLTAPEMIDAAHQGGLDVLFSVGGNFLEVLPEPAYVRTAMERIPLRVHMDIVLSSQMLVDTNDTVVLLPATTRYEAAGGVTETSTERRVIFSPEISGPRVAQARDEWRVLVELAARARPELASRLHFDDTAAIRREIASAIPFYDGIQRLEREGDQFQYGGPHLCAGWKFDMPDGKARFSPVALPALERAAQTFVVSTRRGKQFNSMIHEARDAITGAARDAVFMSREDADRLGLRDGDAVVLKNERSELRGRVLVAPLLPGNLQLHWPEALPLIDHTRRSPQAGIPDYNTVVRLEKLDGNAKAT